jgi:hypothetical protein
LAVDSLQASLALLFFFFLALGSMQASLAFLFFFAPAGGAYFASPQSNKRRAANRSGDLTAPKNRQSAELAGNFL